MCLFVYFIEPFHFLMYMNTLAADYVLCCSSEQGDWEEAESVCNTDCFTKFLQGLQQTEEQQSNLGDSEHQANCAQAPPIGRHLMQHIVCKKVFSDLESDRQSRTYYQEERGGCSWFFPRVREHSIKYLVAYICNVIKCCTVVGRFAA